MGLGGMLCLLGCPAASLRWCVCTVSCSTAAVLPPLPRARVSRSAAWRSAAEGGSRSKSAKFRLTSHLHVPHDSEALQDPYGVRQPVWSASDRITANESHKSAHFGALMFLIPFISTAGT